MRSPERVCHRLHVFNGRSRSARQEKYVIARGTEDLIVKGYALPFDVSVECRSLSRRESRKDADEGRTSDAKQAAYDYRCSHRVYAAYPRENLTQPPVSRRPH